MSTNKNMNKAKVAKDDEFYTRMDDIEKEVLQYTEYFKGKIVLCNCDNPFESNFFKFFASQFKNFGLKKLIATCYYGGAFKPQGINLFDKGAYAVVMNEYIGDLQDVESWLEEQKTLLKESKKSALRLLETGDFASEECVKFLDEADIVVTNPPFSKFREFVSLLMEHKKQFLIIGNMNAITYKEVFPLIKGNKLWFGYDFNKSSVFNSPYKNVDENNKKFATRIGSAICWFTNLPVKKRDKYLDLVKKYSPDIYPLYDNYNAINVNKVSDIPDNEWFEMTVNEERYNSLKATYGDDCVLIEEIDDDEAVQG